ncbi:polysaccharide lyase family 7 protein [Oidiodendron maius Zn]|uniref:Polysaccharide lyase family 7 protein n=1 Tax=Oidiodendron maius (strain Zn) TaxID=913774 RepID=A0A0C3HWM0_OIDMZ|nr:polysaccharide lyase family 7 protein [Oidiodendron maius Zn]
MQLRPAIMGALLLVPVAMAVPAPMSPGGETPTMSLSLRSPSTSSAPPSETSGLPSSGDDTTGSSDSTISGDGAVFDYSSILTPTGGGSGATSIDFSKWTLQLPVGSPGKPQSVAGSELSSYADPKKEYYYVDSSTGAVIMKVPGSPSKTGCVTTTNSKHCRTELRESSPASWDPKADSNSMTTTLMVVKADDSTHGTCIGQIHIDDKVSVRPVGELYYSQQGVLSMGVEHTAKGGDQTVTEVGNVSVGTKFSYTIAYEKGELSVAINGGEKKVLSTYQLDSPPSYFKAGNYNQGDSASEVHFFGIDVQH